MPKDEREIKTDADLLDFMSDLHRVFIGSANNLLKEFRLRTGQASILMIVGRYGRLNQKVIGEYRHMSPGTISVLIGRMEHDGLVLRKDPLAGGKGSDVVLSERGLEIYKLVSERMDIDVEVILKGLEREDRDRLKVYYMQIMHNLTVMQE